MIESDDPVAKKAIRMAVSKYESKEEKLFFTAIQSLSDSKSTDDLQASIRALNQNEANYLKSRETLLRVIENQADNRAIPLLLTVYGSTKEQYNAFEYSMTKTLGKMDDKRVIPILISLAKNKKVSLNVREAAVEILAAKNDPAIAEMLAVMLKDPSTQEQVHDLGISVVEDLKNEKLILALISAINDEQVTYHSMVDAMIRATQSFEDPKMIPVMISVAKDIHLPSRIRKRALSKLAQLKDKKSALDLAKILDEADGYIFYDEIYAILVNAEVENLDDLMEKQALNAQRKWTGKLK